QLPGHRRGRALAGDRRRPPADRAPGTNRRRAPARASGGLGAPGGL
ncbi:MAG: Oxidoreductase, partial [uncultured Blastococcus sp.]